MAEWTWEPDDFAALWYSDANDRFPRPLHYLSRFRYLEDFDAHRQKVCNSYSFDEMDQIRLAIHTLTTSNVRIEILGGTTRTKNAAVRQYRILGARNPHHAVVLSQSVIDDTDGPIRLRMCRHEHLPTRIINWLLPSNPGTHPPATFHEDDAKPPRDGNYMEDPRTNPRERYRRLLGRPSDGGGSAALYTGSILDRPEPWETLQWYDITDDGRYTELRKIDQIKIRPTAPQDLAAQFTTWIDKAAQRLREDEDDAW